MFTFYTDIFRVLPETFFNSSQKDWQKRKKQNLLNDDVCWKSFQVINYY